MGARPFTAGQAALTPAEGRGRAAVADHLTPAGPQSAICNPQSAIPPACILHPASCILHPAPCPLPPAIPRFRLLITPPADGFTNMAVDEAIAQAHGRGEVPPTLRLYAWRPAAISAGYFQRVAQDINLEACRAAGVDVVRRLTGGRAVLHDDEVTYSVVVSEARLPALMRAAGAEERATSLMASYRLLSAGLIAGLARLGLNARLAPGRRPEAGPSGADCFAAAARCDLVVGDKKICGSAQVRHAGVVLQHGALLLSVPDTSPYWREAGAPPNATDLTRALGRRPAWQEVANALAAGFAEALGVPFEPDALTLAERAAAEQLRREKYATEAWNLRR